MEAGIEGIELNLPSKRNSGGMKLNHMMNSVQELRNLWDHAANAHKDKKKKRENTSIESTMFFIGSRQSGKTSIILKFLERSDHPKPSVALEYYFGRRAILGTRSDVCHIFELAGGTTLKKMISIPINSRNLMSLVVILVLDLSIPQELIITIDCLFTSVKDRINSVIQSTEKRIPGFASNVESAARARIGDRHQDIGIMDILPVPSLVLGTKYDIFRDLEPEHKKIICRCLRFLAHSYGASLQFVSQHTPDVLTTRFQEILKNGNESREKPNMDYNTALNISFGEDTFEDIGIFDVANRASLEVARRVCRELMKKTFGEKEIDSGPDDTGTDPNFKEYDIDVVLAQKLKELEVERSSSNILRNVEIDLG